MTVARPILMSGPMVRASLDGLKSQTRRALKKQPLDIIPMRNEKRGREWVTLEQREPEPRGRVVRCRYGLPGDLLWVRESWQHAAQKYCSCPQSSEPSPCDDWSEGTGCRSNRGDVVYAADGGKASRWRPSIHMPRWASRITLRITNVRVERLQDINASDCYAEGVERPSRFGLGSEVTARDNARNAYAHIWIDINGEDSWRANPWVWCISFDVLKQNVDTVMRAAA